MTACECGCGEATASRFVWGHNGRRKDWNGTQKACSKCGTTKPLDQFYGHGNTADGKRPDCKACFAAAGRAHRENLPKDHYAERYRDNRDRERAYSRASYQRHRERRMADVRAWMEANPERRREIARKGQLVRRARKVAAFVEDFDSLTVLELDDGICGICGKDVDPFAFTIDHIVPLARGGEHSLANAQVAHRSCNSRKGVSLGF